MSRQVTRHRRRRQRGPNLALELTPAPAAPVSAWERLSEEETQRLAAQPMLAGLNPRAVAALAERAPAVVQKFPAGAVILPGPGPVLPHCRDAFDCIYLVMDGQVVVGE